MAGPFGAAQAGGGAAASPLDGPPPSPTPMGGPPQGGAFGMKGLAGPSQVPSGQMPPEVLTGLTAAAQTINQQLDAFAQVTPDKATQLALIKELLQQYLAEIMVAGAGPTSPTASGPAFPGGGMDRGIAGPGAV
jgi:hypothetical protein